MRALPLAIPARRAYNRGTKNEFWEVAACANASRRSSCGATTPRAHGVTSCSAWGARSSYSPALPIWPATTRKKTAYAARATPIAPCIPLRRWMLPPRPRRPPPPQCLRSHCHAGICAHRHAVARTYCHADVCAHRHAVARTYCHAGVCAHRHAVTRTYCHAGVCAHRHAVARTYCHADVCAHRHARRPVPTATPTPQPVGGGRTPADAK